MIFNFSVFRIDMFWQKWFVPLQVIKIECLSATSLSSIQIAICFEFFLFLHDII